MILFTQIMFGRLLQWWVPLLGNLSKLGWKFQTPRQLCFLFLSIASKFALFQRNREFPVICHVSVDFCITRQNKFGGLLRCFIIYGQKFIDNSTRLFRIEKGVCVGGFFFFWLDKKRLFLISIYIAEYDHFSFVDF